MDEDAILALWCEDFWNLFFTSGDWNFASFEEAMENFRSYLREGLDTMKADFEANGIDAASLTCTVTECEPIDEKLRAYNGSLAEACFSCVLTDAKLYNVSIIAPDGNEYTTDSFVTAEIEGNWYLISSYAISMWL